MSATTISGNLKTVTSTTIKLFAPEHGNRDPDYDWIPPLKDQPSGKRGSQCGECGMKFEYGKSYGFHCGNSRCPSGWGGF